LAGVILNRNIEDLRANDIGSKSIILVHVPKKDIVNGDLDYIESIIQKLKSFGSKAKQNVLLFFGGYDNVPEEVYEITEIRQWVGKVIEKHPYLFYFMCHVGNNASLIAACLADVQSIKDDASGKVLTSISISPEVSKKIIYDTIEFAADVMDPCRGIDILSSIPGLQYKDKGEGGIE
jgi:hypothetical protein